MQSCINPFTQLSRVASFSLMLITTLPVTDLYAAALNLYTRESEGLGGRAVDIRIGPLVSRTYQRASIWARESEDSAGRFVDITVGPDVVAGQDGVAGQVRSSYELGFLASPKDNIDVEFLGSLSQQYDDNITYARNNKQSDFITAFRPGVTLTYENKETLATLRGDITQQVFWEHTGNTNTSEHLSINVGHQLTKNDQVAVTDAFSHTFEPRSFDEEFESIGGRYSYFRNTFDAFYVRNFSEQLRARAGYGFDVDLTTRADLIDSTVNRAYLEGDYAFTSKTGASFRYNFLTRSLDPGGDAGINTVSGNLRHNFTGHLSIQGGAGMDIINSYNGENIVRPLWTAGITDQINERTSADVTYTQRYSTNAFTSDVLNSWRISGTLRRDLTKRLSGSVSTFYGRGEFSSLSIKDNFLGGSVSLSCAIMKNLRATLSYNLSRLASNQDAREYDKNVIFLGFNITT